jgi:hypothetical protein
MKSKSLLLAPALACLLLSCRFPFGNSEEATGTIEVLSIVPADSAVVSASDTIRATVRCEVTRGFDADRYFMGTMLFEGASGGPAFMTHFNGVDDNSGMLLTKRVDTLLLWCPLTRLWSDSRLGHPVKVKFALDDVSGDGDVRVSETEYHAYRE